MSRMRGTALACCAAFVAYLIASCSGGGGGGGTPPPQFVVSPTNLSFSAASPNDATPPPQAITATVNGVSANTLFVRVVVTGPAVPAVDNLVITGPNSGRLSVHVASPSTIGPGSHASVITVTACTTDINCSGPQLTGSPATINVAYQVGAVPPPPDAVTPSVGTANVSDEVIIRGRGFLPGTLVSFGGTPAVTSTVVSATEIRATYPALTAGPKAISLNNGAIPFTASLQIVDPPAFTSTMLVYPAAIQSMRGLAYDARRSALLVGANLPTPSNNQVWRYSFDGTNWQVTPDIAVVANLRDLALSRDGAKLLTITDTTLAELDPATLLLQATTVRTTNIETSPDSVLRAIVTANDGQAVVVSRSPNIGQHWLYAIATRTFSMPFGHYSNPVAGGPENGSRAIVVQEGVSPPQAIQQYNASSGFVSSTGFELAHLPQFPVGIENVNPPVFDRSGSRMVVAAFLNTPAYPVYDANFGELGRLPTGDLTATTAAYALSPGGTRAYILETGTALCRVRAFDLTSPAGPGVQFSPVGATIDLMPNCPATNAQTPIRMLIDPTGTTAFIAGNLRISVVTPLP